MNPVVSALCWSCLMASSFVVSAWITPFASPLATTGLRFAFALLIMTPIYLAQPRTYSETLMQLLTSPKRLMQYGVISGSLVGFFIGLFTALKTTSSLNTSVIYTLVPLMGAVLALVLGTPTRLKQWCGYLLGSGGAVTVLLFTREGSLVWHSGDAIYIGACLLLALHVVSVQLWSKNVSAFTGAYRIMFFGTLWLLPITLLWGELDRVQWSALPFWSMLFYLTVFTTLLTFVLQQAVVSRAGAKRLLAFSYTIPIWVACYSAFSHSSLALLSMGFMIGSVFVLIALVLIDDSLGKLGTIDGSATP
jgi:drug/metabolite transporter (DMT)-like permease